MPTHHFVIVLVVFASVAAGFGLARSGRAWSAALRVPSWTPSRRTIRAIWLIVYVLAAVAAVLVFEAGGGDRPAMLAALFLVNALLNVAWCFLFFVQRQIGSASLEGALLALSVAMLMVNSYPASPLAAILLVPYLLWTLFATGLTYAIFRLNA